MRYDPDEDDCQQVDFIGSLLRRAPEGQETVFDIANETDGEGNPKRSVSITRRIVHPEHPTLPPLRRSRRAAHRFSTADSVANYINQYGCERTVVVADANKLEATIILDESEEFGDVIELSFAPMFHPVFNKWNSYFAKPVEIEEFAQFVMENRRQVQNPDGRELALMLSQVKLAKNVTIQRGKGAKVVNGVTMAVEIAGVKHDVEEQFPDSITINTPIFLEDEPVNVEFDLLVFERHDEVYVTLTNPEISGLVVERFMANISDIRETLNHGLVTYGSAARSVAAELTK